MGNTVNKDEVVIAQSEAQIREVHNVMTMSYIGWAIVIVLMIIMVTYILCRYGINKVKKWLLSQIEKVQDTALSQFSRTTASFRRSRNGESSKVSPKTNIEVC